jgi:hypothetical protein
MQGQRDRLESGAEVKSLALAALLAVSTASAQAPEPVPSEDFDVFCGATHCLVKKEVLLEMAKAKSPRPRWGQT